MKLYLAGPMRGYAEFNHPAFLKAAAMLRESGHEVLCPAEHDRSHGLTGAGLATGDIAAAVTAGFSLREALGFDTAWICAHAEGIVVLPGWSRSLGARAEVALGAALGLRTWDFGRFLLYGATASEVAASWHDRPDD